MKTKLLGGAVLCALMGMAACGGSPVAAPAELKVEGGLLSWSGAAENASALRIERQAGGGRFEVLTTLPLAAAQYRDETATAPGTIYTYRLLAMDADPWDGTYSQQASFTAP